MFSRLFGFFSSDIGIDLGTANTLVYIEGEGIVLREPSVVAVSSGNKREVLAVGDDAKRMLGRTPSGVIAVRPLRDGVIADFELTEAMLLHFMEKVRKGFGRFRPRTMVIAVPSGITEVEKRAVRDSALRIGAREVRLIEESLSAAIGAGLPVEEAAGNLIIDIGGGTTEVALISLSGFVHSSCVRVAGDELDESIMRYLKEAYHLRVGENADEEIKIRIGSAFANGKMMTMEIKGTDTIRGLPKAITVTSEEVREAMRDPLRVILDSVRTTLEHCPPELAADLVDRGGMLCGGGALLRGMDQLISDDTGLRMHIADDPLSTVAEGAGRLLRQAVPLASVGRVELRSRAGLAADLRAG